MKATQIILLFLLALLFAFPSNGGAEVVRTMWTTDYDGAYGSDYGWGAAIDSEGNVISAGYVKADPGPPDHVLNAYVAKYTRDGSLDWDEEVDSGPLGGGGGQDGNDLFYDVCVDSKDNIIVVGVIAEIWPTLPTNQAMIIQKYNPAGDTLLWEERYYDYGWAGLHSVVVDANDDIYVTGNLFTNWGSPAGQWATLKYDEGGGAPVLGPILYDYSGYDFLQDRSTDLAVDAQGNIVVVGVRGESGSSGSVTNDYDWHVRKYNSAGTLLWADTYGGGANLHDYAWGVDIDGNGDVIVAGYTNKGTDNSTNANYDWLIIKYTKDGLAGAGDRAWTRTFESSAGRSEICYDVVVDADDNIMVGGYEKDGSDISHRRLELLDGTNGGLIDSTTWPATTNQAIHGMSLRGHRLAIVGYEDNGSDYDIRTTLATTAYYVPDHFPSIQEAIDDSSVVSGDIIIVRDGVYSGANNRNIDFGGKAITLRSENGPANCIIDCEDSAGGFIFWQGETSASVLDGFTILNGAAGYGGGIYCANSSPTIRNCRIEASTAAYGGGVCFSSSSATLTNCFISNNTGDYGAAGIYCYDSDIAITNCTVIGNTSVSGGGIFCYLSDPVITNSIFYDNVADYGPQMLLSVTSAPTVSYSDVEGGSAAVYVEPGCTLNWGSGNINSDPLFRAEENEHLAANSPCVNAGTDASVTSDIDGHARPQSSAADMGCDEYFAYYVPDDYATIQQAVDACVVGEDVIVRDGTYTGTGNKDIDIGGKAILLRSENGAASVTIDCEGSGRGFSMISGESKAMILDGFTITNGLVGGAELGGAIEIDGNSHPRILNCVMTGNEAYRGGGLSVTTSSSPLIEGCIISSNTAGNAGGIYIYGDASPTINECAISDNTAGEDAGGIYARNGSSPLITNCVISGNVAPDDGGGIVCWIDASPTFRNCLITGNSGFYGGAMEVWDNCDVQILNCTISDNTAYEGGAIYAHSSSPTIIDSNLGNNSATTSGAELSLRSNAVVSVTYSNIEGGQAGADVEAGSTLTLGAGSMNHDPMFATGPGGAYYLNQIAAGQMADSMCVDAGSDTAAAHGMDSGYTTRTDEVADSGTVDVGYHYPGATPSATLTTINLTFPANGGVVTNFSFTMTWTVDGGANNAYAVDFGLSPTGPWFSTFDNLHITINTTSYAMTAGLWNIIPNGTIVYWRVRGADLSQSPLSIVTSAQVWSFLKSAPTDPAGIDGAKI